MSVATIKLSLLMLVFIPLLISNLRTGMVKNGMLGTMFAIGVLVAFFDPAFGAQPLKLFALLGWGLTAGLLLGIAAYGAVSGGVAKLLIALLPWFPFGEYLLAVTIGMLLAAAVAHWTGKNALIVPPMMLAALAVWLLPILGFEPL